MKADEWLRGKSMALRTLATQARYFRNWREVFEAYRARQTLPPLRLRSGATLYHSERDNGWSLFREIFIEGCYTGGDFYRPKPSDVVLDCGANIGFFALYLESEARGIRVHCFEPSEATRGRLLENVTRNGLSDFVSIHPVAVLDREGEVSLAAAPSAGDTRISADAAAAGSERARCVSLDQALSLCGSPRVDLLKVDVEGAEIEIVRGASADAWSRISRVAMEYHEGLRPGCREQVVGILSRHYAKVSTSPLVPSGELGIIRAF